MIQEWFSLSRSPDMPWGRRWQLAEMTQDRSEQTSELGLFNGYLHWQLDHHVDDAFPTGSEVEALRHANPSNVQQQKNTCLDVCDSFMWLISSLTASCTTLWQKQSGLFAADVNT